MLRCRCNGMINAGCSGTTRMRSASLTRSPTPYINDANKRLSPSSSYSNASTSGSASLLGVVTNPIDIGLLRLIGIATEAKHPLHLIQKRGGGLYCIDQPSGTLIFCTYIQWTGGAQRKTINLDIPELPVFASGIYRRFRDLLLGYLEGSCICRPGYHERFGSLSC